MPSMDHILANTLSPLWETGATGPGRGMHRFPALAPGADPLATDRGSLRFSARPGNGQFYSGQSVGLGKALQNLHAKAKEGDCRRCRSKVTQSQRGRWKERRITGVMSQMPSFQTGTWVQPGQNLTFRVRR